MSENLLAEICRDIFEAESINVEPESRIRESENWSSFGHIQFMIAVEESFGVEFTTDEVQNVETFGELNELIHAKGGKFE